MGISGQPDAARCGGCRLFAKVVLYITLNLYAELAGIWDTLIDHDIGCGHDPLPANQSGVKILVWSVAKTGTRTMSTALHGLGLKAYHSEELSTFVWSRLADEHWLRPEHGGRRPPIAHPFLTLAGAPQSRSDLEVLRALRTEDFAAALSRCRPDALLFDGVEGLMEPALRASPDAKVLMLSWRSHAEWRKSLESFGPVLLLYTSFLAVLQCSGQGLLPWGALFRAADPLLGRPVERMLLEGGPDWSHGSNAYTVAVRLYHVRVNLRRVLRHWFSGLAFLSQDPADYDALWEAGRRLVPKERLLEWDMRRHTWADLCDFVGLPREACPGEGLLPRVPNIFCFERDHPWAFWGALAIYCALHAANWSLLGLMLGVPARLHAIGRRLLRK